MSTLSAIHGITSTVFSNLFITLPIPQSEPGLSEKTYIVTGANQGLGYEACKHLLRIGVGKIIMGVRTIEKGEAARKTLLEETNRSPDSVQVWDIDMASYASVQAFAQRASTLTRLDGVLANAGILTAKFAMAEDNEAVITVNVVCTFLLFLLILPKLRASPGGTAYFVIPNSGLHYTATIKEVLPAKAGGKAGNVFERLSNPSEANMANRYSLSKLLVLLVTRALDARLKQSKKPGATVIINTPNPSYCKSSLIRDPDQTPPPDFIARSTEMGSRALVHGLFAGKQSAGQYINNCHVQAPASFATNKTGAQIQEAFFSDLLQKLDSIVPGVTQNI
ncbi:hypothetical protein SEUCBS140593_001521 [Sporothrix eucalyptigena]|uniref:Uncharacterized protein n=1 Tax=Sporothrix eucalyptigena TaxID=1812306 RepID=A0ABP0AYZ0_9PEZI